MTFSIINKSQLEGAQRIDAEYYQPEYLHIAEKLKTISHDELGNIAEEIVSFGAYDLTNYIKFADTGIPFIKGENIKEGYLDFANVQYLDEKSDEILSKSRVSEKQVLFAMSGSIGNASIAYKIPNKLNSNQDIVKISLKKEYSPFFLTVFLNCDYGKKQIMRLPVGSVQQHIFIWQTKTLMIPIFPKIFTDQIDQIYIDSLTELEDSKKYYFQAENLLLEKLGLQDFEEKNELFSIVNFSEIEKTKRMDAEYFQPKYEKLIETINKHNGCKLNDLATVKKGIEIGAEAYKEEGKTFIRVSSISKDGIVDRDQKFLSNELFDKLKKDFQPTIGEVLMTKDASPGVTCVLNEGCEGIVSGGVVRLKIKKEIDCEPEFLVLCVNSLIGQLQIEREVGGSIILHWKTDQIKNFHVPLLSKEIQQQISDLVKKSHEARKKSKQLLEEAKRKVEEMIEKGNG